MLFRSSTAGAIYRPRGLALRVDPALREIGAGVWEDVPWGQLLHDHRDSLTAFLDCRPDWQVDGSETFQGVRQRMDRAIRRIAAVSRRQRTHYPIPICDHVLDYAVKMGAIQDNPCRRVTLPPAGAQ